MIGSLRGKILEVNIASLLVEVGGIGYVVKVATPVIASCRKGEDVFLYVHDHVREDAHDLFGFLSHDALRMFDRLLSVNGVGPKVALTVMSAGSVDMVKRAIMKGDLTLLTSVPGVGKKTAQKIILEMKGIIVEEGDMQDGDTEVVEALVSLGYGASQARDAVKGLSRDVVDVSARVRAALKRLSK